MINNINMVDIKYLKTFHKVTECKSFSVAADSLFLTQPAVSQHIKKIEERIGATILKRGRDITLTPEGEILYKYTKRSMELYHGLFEELNSLNKEKRYRLAISSKFCTKMAYEFNNHILNFIDDSLFVTYFEDEHSLELSDYDVVLGLQNIPEKSGSLIKVADPRYSIFYDKQKKPNPRKVVHSKTLDHTIIKELMEVNGLDPNQTLNWIRADTSLFMREQVKCQDTIVICPCWSLSDIQSRKITTHECIDCYAWCDEQLASHLKEKHTDSSFVQILTNVTRCCCSNVRYEPLT